MQFTPIHIKKSLDTAQTLREIYFNYHHRPDHTHISVNALLKIAQTTYGKQIVLSFHKDHYKDHYIHSFIHVEADGSYHICLLSGMSNCWNRFALCKELFHVILDEENARHIKITEHLQDFRAAARSPDISGRESSKSEILCEFSAMQFLFPYGRRQSCIEELQGRLEKGESKKVILTDIAERFRIPRLYAEDYLEQEMMDFFEALSWVEKSDAR